MIATCLLLFFAFVGHYHVIIKDVLSMDFQKKIHNAFNIAKVMKKVILSYKVSQLKKKKDTIETWAIGKDTMLGE